MNQTTIWTLILSLALASAAMAATDEQNCQKAKLIALGKRDLCLQKERGKEVTLKTADTAGCEDKFTMSLMKADEKAAKKGASCRWLNNTDGTATDLNGGLQWELKTDDGSVHDKDNTYTWNTTVGGTTPNGTAFTAFLGTLNNGTKGDGTATSGCFAGHCDWRLPAIEELAGIVGTAPGPTVAFNYWSATSYSDPDAAWCVDFSVGGNVLAYNKDIAFYVRAVRSGL
jgi:hypothetical protein